MADQKQGEKRSQNGGLLVTLLAVRRMINSVKNFSKKISNKSPFSDPPIRRRWHPPHPFLPVPSFWKHLYVTLVSSSFVGPRLYPRSRLAFQLLMMLSSRGTDSWQKLLIFQKNRIKEILSWVISAKRQQLLKPLSLSEWQRWKGDKWAVFREKKHCSAFTFQITAPVRDRR